MGAWCRSLSCFNLLTCVRVKPMLSSVKHRHEPSGRKQLQLFNTNVVISLIAGESLVSRAAIQASDYTVAFRGSEVSLFHDQVRPRVSGPIIKTVWKVSSFITNQSLREEIHSDVLFLWLTRRRKPAAGSQIADSDVKSSLSADRQSEYSAFNGRRTLWGCSVLQQTAWHQLHT